MLPQDLVGFEGFNPVIEAAATRASKPDGCRLLRSSLTAVHLDHPLGDGEAETRPPSPLRKEGVFHATELLLGNPIAPVPDDDLDLLLAAHNLQLDDSALRLEISHGLHRIEHQIHDDLPQLPLVSHHIGLGETGYDTKMDLTLPGLGSEELAHTAHQVHQVDRFEDRF